MPRPTRAFGRPGTEVIPRDWDTSHAPVVDKTLTGRCVIYAPTSAPPINDDLTYPETADRVPLHDGPFRLQRLSDAARKERLGEQVVTHNAYLLVVSRPAAGIRRGSLVRVLESSDPDLVADGTSLYVASVTLGSQRWERDLTVVDDLGAL